ncbi:DUF3488 and transglutaminase-like domain-containing protein [Streptomyces sannanensis]|uniref:DUF3488 and transglutaminase-like domain-containing protein n=1 Tax=Streptomyces sannanensis TaxID=285536 RepID=A0ABP6S7W2_9ACTN
MALFAYIATMLAAGALMPLIGPAGWIAQAGALLAVLSGVGVLARRVPLARPLTVAGQALVALLMLTWVFAGDQALGGVLPGPEVFREFGRLLGEGADDVGRYAIPAPATEGIRLLLVGGVLVIGLTVDALAVTFRSAAPAGLPLLALYSVAAGLTEGGARWLNFVCAGAGYLLLLLAEGRDRLSQWGRVFGGGPGASGSGPGPQNGSPLAPVRTGRRIGAVALGVALVAPAALPALDGGLLPGTGNGNGNGNGSGGTITAVNPLVSLQNSLNQPDDREVLRYRTNAPTTADLYLRIVALDQFDGSSWKTSERRVTDVPKTLPLPAGLSPDNTPTNRVSTAITTADWYAQNWLPLPYPATAVNVDGHWRYEPTGRTLVGDHGQTTRDLQYSVTSLIVRPTRDKLATAPAAPAALLREYTEVPKSLPAVVRSTALKVTKGASNDYERAVRLQNWFAVEGGFRYDTHVESGTGAAAIARFLEQREGFCVHFSFSMAAMARTLGIPARVAVGFTPGTKQADGSMSVGLRDAHAWPELYFEGVGWTRFEPTPSRGTLPEYTRPESPTDGASNPAEPLPGDSELPSAAPSSSSDCTPQLRRLGDCGDSSAVPVDDTYDDGTPPSAILWPVLAVVVLVLVPLMPALWRVRARTRRLRPGAGTLDVWQEVTDTAWDHGIPPDDSQTPRKAAARIVRLGGLEGAPAEAVHRLAGAVEQVLYAPEPGPLTGLAEDAHRVRAGLYAAAGSGRRLRARLAPRSAVRAVWVFSARRAAAAARLRALWPDTLLRRVSRQRG